MSARWEVDLLDYDDDFLRSQWEEPSIFSATMNALNWTIGDIRSVQVGHNDAIGIFEFITELVHEIGRLQRENIDMRNTLHYVDHATWGWEYTGMWEG